MKKALLMAVGFWLVPDFAFSQADPWKNYTAVVRSIKAPKFKRAEYPITQFGAKAGGVEDCTDAFKAAIDACNKKSIR